MDQTLQPKTLNIKQLSLKLSSKLRFAYLCHGLILLFYQKLHLSSHTNPQLLLFEFPPLCSPKHLEDLFVYLYCNNSIFNY